MDLRLATFNLENLGVREGEDDPARRARIPRHLAALRGVLRRLDADAVAFQELIDPALLSPLLDGLGYPHVVVADPGPSPLRIGVASRYPLTGAEAVARDADLSVTDPKTGLEVVVRGPFSRPALRVKWEAPGLETTLVVVHWKSKIPSPTPARRPGPDEPWARLGDVAAGRLVTEAKRLAQAVELRREVDRLLAADPDARVAVLGDFNDTLGSEGLRIVAGDARAAASPTLEKEELVACERAIPRDLRFTQIYRGTGERLDHILISPGLVPHFVDARIYNETLRPADEHPAGAPASVGSDHAPVVAVFRP